MASSVSGPTPPGLPPLPPGHGDYFTETQWCVLMSLLDATVPSITAVSDRKDDKTQLGITDAEFKEIVTKAQASVVKKLAVEDITAYLAESPSNDPAFCRAVRRVLGNVPPSAQKRLGGVLSALSTRPGSLLLTGYATPIQDQPLHIRESILRSWSSSWFGTPRTLYKIFTAIAKVLWLQTSPLFRTVTGYPDVPINWNPGPTEDFGFLQFDTSVSEPATVDTDVVIIGSGCGGGVCAKVLAEAGHRVLVVDKGYYFNPSQLPMPMEQSGFHLFENNGLVNSVDGSLNTVAGSCWGGGGSVNWSVSLQTPGYVRKEWSEQHGLPFFESAEFQNCLDRVYEFMGVVSGDKVRTTYRGQKLLEGSRKLGYEAHVCPQNNGGKEHWCGHCPLGCGSAEKQGPAVSWLPAAAKKGATFMEGFSVDKILWDESSSSSSWFGSGGKKKAVGVEGTWTARDTNGGVIGERQTRKVVIKAKKVIVSAGTLNSPLILHRSGLNNHHIGRNLHVHPVKFIGAYYEDDVNPWEGGVITTICTAFENLDGQGHGVKLEDTCMLPHSILSQVPWRGALSWKLSCLRYPQLSAWLSLSRDRDTGRVYADPVTGKLCIEYTISSFDASLNFEGIIALAKIAYVTGASEIDPFLPGVEPFVRSSPGTPSIPTEEAKEEDYDKGVKDPLFEKWLSTLLHQRDNAPICPPYISAHQMSTCRMSSKPENGVVDPKGKVWGTEGLYVADASVFPSASGVNPMVTNMAIADWIANGVARDLGKKT
ncbi:long-chain fatty alcohol dehydrogenase [Neurospora hispaniola]|uniref:Long-chain-alcohol oxidase n=1 Tax=Neurospora hispaniola TaxID=588809 RepID=A0AAJ0IBK8_9PEZI|nr:long-chain fatty alcohol dehydrogenase [Neurospora hispaniola]